MSLPHQISVINHTEVLGKMYRNAQTKISPRSPILQLAPIHRLPSSAKVRLFAVLVGINTYPVQGLGSLRGAVADAHGFKEYLETCLAVPSDQITILTEKQATRSAIVNALQRLQVDERIDVGDAILFYYAGHGTELDAPASWTADKKIQAIVPYDCDSFTPSGEIIRALPDYTINRILSNIAEKKGDNILVIFDCCHSASGTRSAHNADASDRVRSANLASSACPANLDQDVLGAGTRSACPAAKYHTRGLGSHTLLAACGAEQQAKEDRDHGRFSSSLLALLRKVSPENLRYGDILTHPSFPKIDGQDPQCEGLNLNRALFNAKVLPSQRKFFPVRYSTSKRCYVVDAGTIHRITKSTEFKLYRKSDITRSKLIGVLIADQIKSFITLAHESDGIEINLGQPTIAIVARFGDTGDLRIKVPLHDGFRDTWKTLRKSEPNLSKISLSESPEHLEARLSAAGKVAFTINIDHQQRGLPKGVDTAVHHVDNDLVELRRVVFAAAHFFGELGENKCNSMDAKIPNNIDIQCYQLQDESLHFLDGPVLQPVGPNIFQQGVINLRASEEIAYGLCIKNESGYDLYANIFQFNPNNLQILPVAESHNSGPGKLDVPLKRYGGSLAVGYTNDGYPPMLFDLPEESNAEVVFLKIYLTTQPVDLSYIKQDTPFLGSSRGMKQVAPASADFWFDIVIPVIQWREQPPATRIQN